MVPHDSIDFREISVYNAKENIRGNETAIRSSCQQSFQNKIEFPTPGVRYVMLRKVVKSLQTSRHQNEPTGLKACGAEF
jgi:hypothetical protein